MADSRHPRLDEMAAEFGWVHEIYAGWDPHPTNTHVRGDVGGRVGTLFCWYPGSDLMWWGAGVLWRTELGKRDRKKAKKQSDEFIAMLAEPKLRGIEQDYLSENADKPAKDLRKYGSGLRLGTGGAFFYCLGEPPTPDKIMTIVRSLADLADRVESRLDVTT
jgi:hypothetical protein